MNMITQPTKWQHIKKELLSVDEPGAIPGCAIPDAALEVTVNQVWIYYFDFKQFRHSHRNRNRKENGGRKYGIYRNK